MTDEPRRPKLEISADDLMGPEVDRRVHQMKAAREVPLTVPVGPAPQLSASNWWRGNTASLAVAGLVGGAIGWGLAEIIAQPDTESPWYGDSATTGTIIFMTVIAVALGSLIAGWDGIQARSQEKAWAATRRALPLLIASGIVGGFLTASIFKSMMQDAYERAILKDTAEEAIDTLMNALHTARGVGFAFAAAAIGAALGAASKSGKRALNGAIGGAVGGFLGGFMFDYVGEWLNAESGVMPRLVALLLMGGLVGVGIGLVEAARKENWLEIVSGGMAGKQFILYHDATVVGASPQAHITLIKDPGIAPEHATLTRRAGGLNARAHDPSRPLVVNGSPVTERVLADGDLVQLGQTVVRYREKAASRPTELATFG